MKILIFSDDTQDIRAFDNCLKVKYPDSELKPTPSLEQGLKTLSFDGPYICFVIDVRQYQDKLQSTIEQIYDISGPKPCIFIGERVHVNKHVVDDIFNMQELNCAIERPLEQQAINEAIINCFEWAERESFNDAIEEINPKNLIAMKIKQFYMYQTIPYNAYIEMLPGKYTKVINKDEHFTHSYVNSFAKKNIKDFYLLKTEAIKLLEDGLKKYHKALKNTEKFDSKKLFTIQAKTILTIHQFIRAVGVTEDVLGITYTLIESIHEHYLNFHSINKILEVFTIQNRDISEHALLTAYLSEMMYIHQGWTGDATRQKLGLASILQNVTLENDDLLLISNESEKALTKFTKKDQESFKSHPVTSSKVAQHFNNIPEVDFIISQHHEHPSGNGFPNKLSFLHISTISATFILSSQFVSRYFIDNAVPADMKRIFHKLEKTYNVGSFKEPLKTLIQVISR